MQRAAFELNCDATQLQVTQIAPNAVGVRGCGKRATYLWVRGGNTWVNNGIAEGEGPPLEKASPTEDAAE